MAVTQQNEGIGGRNTAKLRYRWPQHRKMEASVAVTPQNGGIGGRNTAKWRHQWPQHRKIEASVTGNAVKSPIEIWSDIHTSKNRRHTYNIQHTTYTGAALIGGRNTAK